MGRARAQVSWVVPALVVVAVLHAATACDGISPRERAGTSMAHHPAARSAPLREVVSSAGVVGPTWGPPATLSADRNTLDDGFLADVHVHGHDATAVWEAREAPRSRVRVIKVSDRRADGTWTPPDVVVRRHRVNGEWGFASASGPRGTVVVVWNKYVDGHDTLLERHREGGRWSAVRELGDNTAGGVWAAVVDRRGAITVAWANGRSGGSVNVIARGAGGHWGQPQQIAVDADAPRLAVNQRGDVVLAWAASHGVGVAVHRRGSRAWRTTPLLRSPFQYPEDLEVAIDEHGRALVVWGRALDDNSAPRFLAWSRSRPDGTWTTPGYFGGRRPNGVDTVHVAMNAHGQAVATWTGQYGTQASRLEPSGTRWTPPSKLDRGWPAIPYVLPDGTAVAVHAGRWHFQRPGGNWRLGGTFPEARKYVYPQVHGRGSQMSVAYYGQRLSVRFLTWAHAAAALPSTGR